MATNNAYDRFIQVEWQNKSVLLIDELKTTDRLQTVTQALQRALHHFHKIEIYLKDAEEHFNGKALGELTYDECAALQICTREIDRESICMLLNRALCSEDEKAPRIWLPFLRILYSAAQKLPDFKGQCWRIGKADILNQIEKEKYVTWSGISFCSKDRNFIINKCTNQGVVIFAIHSIHGKDISKYSANENQKEILLMPGTRLEVTNIDRDPKNGKLIFVSLQERGTEQSKIAASNQLKSESQFECKHSEPIYKWSRFQMIDYETKEMKPIYQNPMSPNLTLDAAINSIPKKIQHLDTLLQQVNQFHDDNSEEMNAVKIYTMEWGKESLCKLLNEALKSDHQDKIKHWLPYLHLFRAGIQRIPLFKGECWRGKNTNIGSNFKNGQTIIWQGISSCSKSVDLILKCCVGESGTLVKINAINGKDLSNFTLDSITEEVILMPGTTLIVKRMGKYLNRNNIIFVELDEIAVKTHEEVAQSASKPQVSSNSDRSSPSTSNSTHDANKSSVSTKSNEEHTKNGSASKSKYTNDRNVTDIRSGHHCTLVDRLTDVDCENKVIKPIENYQKRDSVTLEEALDPARNIVANLDENIRKAKLRANKSSRSILNIDESAAIYLYTMQVNETSFSRILNQALRSDDQRIVKEYWLKYLQLLWQALKKLPSVRGHVFQCATAKINEKYPKEQMITWWGITSCTQTPDEIVGSFLGKKLTLLNIKIINGKDISEYSCKSYETEIILLPGTRLRVKDLSKNFNLNIYEIDLEEIDDAILLFNTMRNLKTQRVSKDVSLGFGLARQSHQLCTFETNKIWLECRFKDQEGRTIIKPNECEDHLVDPRGNIDEHILKRVKGSMFGLVVGDALGAHVEFRPHSYLVANPVTDLQGGGTWGLEKGQFTDDGSMALCLANSLVARRDFVPYDQLVRYKWWFRHGYMSSTGNCFDIGESTRKAICQFEDRQKMFAEKNRIPLEELDFLSDAKLLEDFNIYCSSEGAAGNGVLMRLAPVPLFFYRNPQLAIKYSGISGKITHGDKKAGDACRYYGALIVAIMNNIDKDQLLSEEYYLSKLKNWFKDSPLDVEIENVAKGSFKRKNGYDDGIRGKGYVVQALEAALWAFWITDSFEKGALEAVNLGDDTDTTATIYGQLAGAYYGYDKIPSEWIQCIYAKRFIECICKWIAYEGSQLHSDN
ncbi:unnamed protein product [Rotaria socialis]|uniref:ADP-ribosylhydrolase ARH3 n=1 Tax=Rotaria socialis TaxID=392032 RepID=A0A821A7E2_9BILA|nr:unnamed protein product [Rotaria socialis]